MKRNARRATAYPSGFALEQDNATGRVTLLAADLRQSMADRRGVSMAPYIHAIFGLIRQAGARRVLMIGCGGGTLASMLRMADVDVTVVDIDASSLAIARDYFHMPDDVECHVADGYAFLKRHKARYDAIVLDAYDGDKVPVQFLKPAFYALAKKRLARGGVFLVNVVGDRAQMRGLLAKSWRTVRMLDSTVRGRNAVAVAGNVRALKRPRLLLRPARQASKIEAELKALRWA
jgi:spermidine synthase